MVTTTESTTSVLPFEKRERPDTICLFDVDGTLSKARQLASEGMMDLLARLRRKVAIGVVTGSDFPKQKEQLGKTILEDFDFTCSENGLKSWRLGVPLKQESFIQFIGEQKYKEIVKFVLAYLSKLDLPIVRGTFIEFRNGMINISPIGRNATTAERDAFEAYDQEHGIRRDMVNAMKEHFADLSLTYSIGGQISFDVFPQGWDKSYCLKHIANDGFGNIHFFGDKMFKGGNDYELGTHERVIGHAVKNPEDTMQQLKELFLL